MESKLLTEWRKICHYSEIDSKVPGVTRWSRSVDMTDVTIRVAVTKLLKWSHDLMLGDRARTESSLKLPSCSQGKARRPHHYIYYFFTTFMNGKYVELFLLHHTQSKHYQGKGKIIHGDNGDSQKEAFARDYGFRLHWWLDCPHWLSTTKTARPGLVQQAIFHLSPPAVSKSTATVCAAFI